MERARDQQRGRQLRAVVSGVMLFAILGAYALLETARDTLFLSRLPATKLPWAYLLTAAAVTLFAWLGPRADREGSARRTAVAIVAVAIWTLALYVFGFHTPLRLYALYASVGVAGTLLLVQAWTLIGAQFTVIEARRLFGYIAAAGALGAIAGLALATRLLRDRGPSSLIPIAAAVLVLASGLPLVLRSPRSRATATASARAPLGHMARTHYARRVFWLIALTTIMTTTGDFLFKSSVAASISKDGLGSFLAAYQLGMNVVGLGMQLVIAPLLLRRVGANRSILALPLTSLAAALGFVLAPGLAAGLVLKGVDASLRNSLHRTSTEVLYLPLPFAVRGRLKAIADGVGQRGAQALASLLVLGGLAVGATSMHIAAGTALAAAGALAVAAGLRRAYVDAFRAQVRDARDDAAAPRALDLHSVESLVEMLSSPKDQRVLAALDTLARQGKAKLIPSLLVYHPASEVAMHALALLAESGRRDFLPLTERLLASPSAALAAAAAAVRVERVADAGELRRYTADERAAVRAIGLVALVRKRAADWAEWNELERIAQRGSREDRVQLLAAIARMPDARLATTVTRLLKSDDANVRLEAARALQAAGDASGLPIALELLGVRETRDGARRIFLAAGPTGIELLARALVDAATARAVRHHIPRTLSRFGNERAAVVLLEALMRPDLDGVTRYKILRGLGRMRRNQPALRLERKKLRRLARHALERARELRRWRASLTTLPPTPTGALLKELVARKERTAVERLFRVLDLLRPGAELERIHDGLGDADADHRAASRELLEYLVDPTLQKDVLALVDGETTGEVAAPPPLAEALAAMRADHSSALRALAEELSGEQPMQEELRAHQR